MPRPKNIIGPQVRRLRDQLGWSQSVLAAKCQVAGWDVSRSIIAVIEGRVRWVGDFELLLLARVLRSKPDHLIPGQVDWKELMPRRR